MPTGSSNGFSYCFPAVFTRKFVIYYSSVRSRFTQLFRTCSPLIFHRNVEWFYYEYYDEYTLNFSFFILNHAVSLFGLSASGEEMSTMIVTDNAVVIYHELLADYVIRRCRAVFTSFQLSDFKKHDPGSLALSAHRRILLVSSVACVPVLEKNSASTIF